MKEGKLESNIIYFKESLCDYFTFQLNDSTANERVSHQEPNGDSVVFMITSNCYLFDVNLENKRVIKIWADFPLKQ